jgi:hypothetical protein
MGLIRVVEMTPKSHNATIKIFRFSAEGKPHWL